MTSATIPDPENKEQQRKKQPLDIAAPIVMALVAVGIAAMLLLGSQALPGVRTFSWQDKAVAADDIAFLLTFTQPMVPESVEENLKIEPALPGKISWAGRRMAYTLDAPAPYGERFEISLSESKALIGQAGFEPFEGEFVTRDRAFVYIGAEGEDTDRLVLFNLTKKEKTLLTPPGQIVLDFKPYPGRDRILFSAVDADGPSDRVASTQLYSVTTGLGELPAIPAWQFWKENTLPTAGETKLVLDNQDFQNLKFDLSADGKTIVIQRVSQTNPADFGPWVVREGEAPRKLQTEPGGDFRIAPDSVSLLLQQGQGTAVINLEPDVVATESDTLLLDFLPDYGLTLDIADDGRSAALVNFNQDDPNERFTQSLFWISNQGEEKLLLQTNGAILSAQFDESGEILYCLVNRLLRTPQTDEGGEEAGESREEVSEDIPGEAISEGDIASDEELNTDPPEATEPVDLLEEEYSLSPYLTAITVETGKEQKLLEMPPQPNITVSLSPDGLAMLFDEALVNDAQNTPLATPLESDYDGPTHRLWLLPLFGTPEERLSRDPVALSPAELDIAGRHPAWLP
ncbi:MAG: hypothetical protein AAGN15_14855 [Cyanobacteria bacterium J06581_3]